MPTSAAADPHPAASTPRATAPRRDRPLGARRGRATALLSRRRSAHDWNGDNPAVSFGISRAKRRGAIVEHLVVECSYSEELGSTAIASIETRRPRGSRTCAGADRAGGGSGMWWAYTSLSRPKSSTSA